MEEKLNPDENSDSGYAPSPSSGAESPTFTTGFSFVSLDSFSYLRTNSEISDDNNYSSSSEAPSPCWPLRKQSSPNLSRLGMRPQRDVIDNQVDTEDYELDMMKERFSKLLLGEDMSGSGKGVGTAVTTSNAITNLYASIFGQHQRLEPLQHEKKLMWEREMNCLLSVCDYILEFEPTIQHFPDGTVREVMGSRQRSDIYLNLPALRKLDAMLLDILESFQETEFWYAEQGSLSGNSRMSGGSFRRQVTVVQPQRTEERWWLPVPCVPSDGLSDKSRKHLKRKRGGANQIYKAAMAINSVMLADMDIPDSYMASLPKSGKASLGDSIYRYMSTTEKFSPDHLLNCLNFSSEHEALELADKVEASMYTWRKKAGMSQNSKSSWDLMKDLVSEVDRNDKNHVLAERAEIVLLCLKQRYPELSQTSLDTCKIQYNTDMGKAVLESYSRVLEGLAFNIVAWIDDVLFVDKNTKTLEIRNDI